MPRSESPADPSARRFDWRGWLALAWVVWFGLLYGRMVVEQRGAKVLDAVKSITRSDR